MTDCAAIRPLLPALVVDALEDAERDAARGHLAGCAPCAGEAAALGRALGEVEDEPPPPDDVWQRIAASLEDVIAREAAAPAGGGSWLDVPAEPPAAPVEEKKPREPRRAEPAPAPSASDAFCVGPYELEEVISRGATGVVFRARHRALGRQVALKVLHEALARSADHVRRFRDEAEALARLNHPGIVPVYEAGAAHGQHYLAMGLVTGEPLAAHLSRGERWAVSRVVTVVVRLARAVHHAHSQGLVHRDLKPANVLVDGDRPVVTDFGLAGQVRGERQALAATGEVHGTPHYMAPEQVRGEAVDRRADVWSLGVILYQLLTHELPFPGEGAVDVQGRVLDEEPTPPRALDRRVDARLEAVVLRALEKDPAHRYPTAQELASDLERAARGETVEASKSRIQPWRASSRLRRFGSAAVVGVLVAGGVGVAALREERARAAQQEAEQRARRERDAAQAREVSRVGERLTVGERQLAEARLAVEERRAEAGLVLAEQARATADDARAALEALGLSGLATQRLTARADELALGADRSTARALSALGRSAEAQQVLQRLAAQQVDLRLLKELAAQLLGGGQRDAARGLIGDALRAAPNDAELHLLLGRLELGAGRLPEALSSFGRARELDPLSADALLLQAEARLTLGEPGRAQRDAAELVKLHPERADGWLVLGRARHASGDLPGAVEALEEARDLAPRDPQALGALAVVRLDQGQLVLRQLDAEEKDVLAGGPPVLWELLGLTHEAALDEEAALAAYQRAIDRAGDDPAAAPAHVRLARLELARADAVRCRDEARARIGHHAGLVPLDTLLLEAARLQVQRTERARAALAAARRLDPGRTDVALLEARLALDERDLQAAGVALERAAGVLAAAQKATTYAPWPALDEPHLAALEHLRLTAELGRRAERAVGTRHALEQAEAFAAARAGAREPTWFLREARARTEQVRRFWTREDGAAAARVWTCVTARHPGDAGAWLQRARLARRAGQWDEAVALLARAHETGAAGVEAHLLEAELFGVDLPAERDLASGRPLSLRDPERAERALAKAGQDPRAHVVRARAVLARPAARRTPDEVEAASRGLRSLLVFTSLSSGQLPLVAEALELFEQLHPGSRGAFEGAAKLRRWLRDQAVVLVARARVSLDGGDLTTALELGDAAISIDPDLADAWELRATTLLRRGLLEPGVLDFARTLQLEPRRLDHAWAELFQGKCTFLDLQRAAEVFQAAEADDPGDARYAFVRAFWRYAFATSRREPGDALTRGLEDVQAALRIDPSFHAAHALGGLLSLERARGQSHRFVALEAAAAYAGALRRTAPELALGPWIEAVEAALRAEDERLSEAERLALHEVALARLAEVEDRSPEVLAVARQERAFEALRADPTFQALVGD